MRTASLLALLAVLAGLRSTAAAGEFPTCGHCRYCGTKICCTKAELAKVTEECWEVECQEICIPRVRFPWTKASEACCGR